MKTLLKQIKKDYLLPISILISAIIIAGAWVYSARLKAGINSGQTQISANDKEVITISKTKVLPEKGVELPFAWNDLGRRMINLGVIDKINLSRFTRKEAV